MDPVLLLLIVLFVVVIATILFAVFRSKQRSGSVLAAPEAFGKDGKS